VGRVFKAYLGLPFVPLVRGICTVQVEVPGLWHSPRRVSYPLARSGALRGRRLGLVRIERSAALLAITRLITVFCMVRLFPGSLFRAGKPHRRPFDLRKICIDPWESRDGQWGCASGRRAR